MVSLSHSLSLSSERVCVCVFVRMRVFVIELSVGHLWLCLRCQWMNLEQSPSCRRKRGRNNWAQEQTEAGEAFKCIYTSCIFLFFLNIKVLSTGSVNVHIKVWIISAQLLSQHFSVRSWKDAQLQKHKTWICGEVFLVECCRIFSHNLCSPLSAHAQSSHSYPDLIRLQRMHP